MARWHRRLLPVAGAMLVATACFGGSGDTTTTAAASTTSASTTTTAATTTTLLPNGIPLASEGDRNATVAAFQFLLNCNGFGPLEVDGAFGPASRAAVEQAQIALGRQTTGAPDEETLALLSRDCDDSRRIEIIDGDGIGVGNVGPSDPDVFFVRSGDSGRLAVVVISEGGFARVDLRAIDGTPIAGGSAAVAVPVDDDVDYVVEVSTVGAAVTYSAVVDVGEVAAGVITAADPGTVRIGTAAEPVSEVCLDTTGEAAFVAGTAARYLVVATGDLGSFGPDHGGIGASIEIVERDGSPEYFGFISDLTIAVGERVVGTVRVFATDTDGVGDAVNLAFNFVRSAAPCAGGEVTPIVLGADGIGIVVFGNADDDTVQRAREAMPGSSPVIDSGWVTVDPADNPYGVCSAQTTEVRVVRIDNLALYFTDAPTTWEPDGGRHFAGYRVIEGAFPLQTAGEVGPGATIAEVLAAHPDAVAAPGLAGGVDVYVSSPPGSDAWLRTTAVSASGVDDTGEEVGAVVGGRFCDL